MLPLVPERGDQRHGRVQRVDEVALGPRPVRDERVLAGVGRTVGAEFGHRDPVQLDTESVL